MHRNQPLQISLPRFHHSLSPPNLSFVVAISVWIGSLISDVSLVLRVCVCLWEQPTAFAKAKHAFSICCYPDSTPLWASWSYLGLIRKPSNQRGRRILNNSLNVPSSSPTCERESNFKTRGVDKMPFTIVTSSCWVVTNGGMWRFVTRRLRDASRRSESDGALITFQVSTRFFSARSVRLHCCLHTKH